jgi:hypothetical protein
MDINPNSSPIAGFGIEHALQERVGETATMTFHALLASTVILAVVTGIWFSIVHTI